MRATCGSAHRSNLSFVFSRGGGGFSSRKIPTALPICCFVRENLLFFLLNSSPCRSAPTCRCNHSQEFRDVPPPRRPAPIPVCLSSRLFWGTTWRSGCAPPAWRDPLPGISPPIPLQIYLNTSLCHGILPPHTLRCGSQTRRHILHIAPLYG